MSVSIKVAVRCRPYTLDDKLGVHMLQLSEMEGEINLVNSTYSTKRFAFSWSWWSAYGWQRHQKGDEGLSEDMKLIHQGLAYSACGVPIRNDVLEGNAVVMFAYGLSGSGKTFTTFGPDDPAVPEAWFKWKTPHDLWGIFPRLGFDLFEMAEQTWKFSMKYFQNVVDVVRDLMSPTGEEKNYKAGMRKDADGFMDIQWCIGAQLKTWDDLRNTFKKSNARKAISPTQFNHQSTRGHCVMTLEVNKPKDDDAEMRQKGRIYVCDLAGTEPAGDIFYAAYKKIKYPDGTIEHKLLGPHKDQRLTKNLQSQGKKINLSLSEMAQFFMKMAQAIKAKKLKPGKSIPGCNSYFLCKYLKDIMLQARTYLFCAIRPEMSYLNYTFSTLGFAKNASVIKLNPKKATTAASPGERKLMKQLDEMKAMMAALKKQNEELQKGGGGGGGGGDGGAAAAELQKKLEEQQKKEEELQKREEEAKQRAKELEARVKELEAGGGGGGGGGGADAAEMAELKAQLAAQNENAKKLNEALEKQKHENNEALKADGIDVSSIEAKRQMEEMLKKKAMEMSAMLDIEGPDNSAQDKALQQQKKEYGARGISLAALEMNSNHAHFVNIDLDPFRSQRFMFFVKEDGQTVFGKDGDVKPFTLQASKQCVITGTGGKFTVQGISEETYHNGICLKHGADPTPLANYDRVTMATEVLLFRVPAEITEGLQEPDPAVIIKEAEEASRTDEQKALEEKMRLFEAMKSQWEHKQKDEGAKQMSKEEKEKQKQEMDKLAMELVNKEILDLLPKTKTTKKYCYELNRDMLSFEVSMQRGSEDNSTPTVKVRVSKNDTKEIILIESFEFSKAASTLQDEHTRLKLALENGREYTSPEAHDPVRLFMDHTTTYGSAIIFPEYLQYQLETEEEEQYVAIKSAMALDQNVGKLEIVWSPLASPDNADTPGDEMFNDTPEELLGRPWTYRLEIRGASGLDIMCSKAYVQYKFFGELYETLTIDDATFAPNFGYAYVHHVESVTQEFLNFLDKPMSFHVYAAPYIKVKDGDQPSTSDPVVVSRITGRAMDIPSLDKMDEKTLRKHATAMEKTIAEKDRALREAQEKINALTKRLQDNVKEIAQLKGSSSTGGNLAGVKAADAVVNGK